MFSLVGSKIGGFVAVATPIAGPEGDWVAFDKKVTWKLACLDSFLVFGGVLSAFQRC